MKQILSSIIALILLTTAASAQERVINATDRSPVSAASILDASGNMVGFTLSDGAFTEIPKTAYPITIRCVGYEQLVIEQPQNRTWEMTPVVYELAEVVVVPVERNVLKQTYYVREHLSMSTQSDTITFFMEHMANRLVAASKDVKYSGDTSIRLTANRCFVRYKLADNDIVVADYTNDTPSMLDLIELSDEPIEAHESLKGQNKLYEKRGKSGIQLVQRENGSTFSNTEDQLAGKKGHSISPWILKLMGCSMKIEQLYSTQVFRANDEGIYQPKDLIEASFVMEADGKGKFIRKLLNSDKPVTIRSMIEIYVVDRKYLTKEDAKKEYKKKAEEVQFVIPSTVPPLDKATQRLVERAIAESGNSK